MNIYVDNIRRYMRYEQIKKVEPVMSKIEAPAIMLILLLYYSCTIIMTINKQTRSQNIRQNKTHPQCKINVK